MSANNQENNHNGIGPQQQSQSIIQHSGNKWPLTRQDGSVYQQDEDILYTQVMTAVHNSHPTEVISVTDYVPPDCGTYEEKEAIIDTILARAQRDSAFRGNTWKQSNYQKPTIYYIVRGNDRKFHNRTIDEVIAELIKGDRNTLELQGSFGEQRKFFAAVRQYISTMTVLQGKDIKEHGAVTFVEPKAQKALATVDELEAMFEAMVLDNMQPGVEEAGLTSALDGMEMSSMQPVAEEVNLASALNEMDMSSMQPAAEEARLVKSWTASA